MGQAKRKRFRHCIHKRPFVSAFRRRITVRLDARFLSTGVAFCTIHLYVAGYRQMDERASCAWRSKIAS